MQKIDIHLKASYKFILLILILLSGSLVMIWSIESPWWIKPFLIMVSLMYGFYILYFKVLLVSKNSIYAISQTADGYWQLLTKDFVLTAELAGDTTVSQLVCILRFKIPGKKLKQSCVIFNDAIEAKDYRRLLVTLKCNRF